MLKVGDTVIIKNAPEPSLNGMLGRVSEIRFENGKLTEFRVKPLYCLLGECVFFNESDVEMLTSPSHIPSTPMEIAKSTMPVTSLDLKVYQANYKIGRSNTRNGWRGLTTESHPHVNPKTILGDN